MHGGSHTTFGADWCQERWDHAPEEEKKTKVKSITANLLSARSVKEETNAMNTLKKINTIVDPVKGVFKMKFKYLFKLISSLIE